MMQSANELLSTFIARRTALIEKLVDGKLNKRSFLDANYELTKLMRPYVDPDTPEECLYNYHYYNALAKVEKTRARLSSRVRFAKRFEDAARNYYCEKDKATMRMLDFFSSEIVHAYFVKTSSHLLHGKLVEILFPMPYVIFHTCDRKIIKRLRDEKILRNIPLESAISTYINALY